MRRPNWLLFTSGIVVAASALTLGDSCQGVAQAMPLSSPPIPDTSSTTSPQPLPCINANGAYSEVLSDGSIPVAVP
jgi:hypothetical protein